MESRKGKDKYNHTLKLKKISAHPAQKRNSFINPPIQYELILIRWVGAMGEIMSAVHG